MVPLWKYLRQIKLTVNHFEFLREKAHTLRIRVCLFPPYFALHGKDKKMPTLVPFASLLEIGVFCAMNISLLNLLKVTVLCFFNVVFFQ